MKEYLIVDGYNIIGAWPELAKLKDVELEEARDRLIGMLADYQAYSGMKVYLVFDAYKVPGLGGKYVESKLEIRYTREKETADELIERLSLSLIGRRRHVYVATSDMAEQSVIFGQGAFRLPARELLVKVKQARRDVEERIQVKDAFKKNSIDSALPEDIKQVFEKWRRGDKK